MHKPGLGNLSNFLLRHPLNNGNEDLEDSEDFVNHIVSHAIPKSMTRDEIVYETKTIPIFEILSKHRKVKPLWP